MLKYQSLKKKIQKYKNKVTKIINSALNTKNLKKGKNK